jgi:hypothetical protein
LWKGWEVSVYESTVECYFEERFSHVKRMWMLVDDVVEVVVEKEREKEASKGIKKGHQRISFEKVCNGCSVVARTTMC